MIYGDQKDRDFLKRYIESLIGAIDAIGKPFEGVPMPFNIIELTYIDLIRRIKCSLLGINAQLHYWPEIGEMKVPISLLFRSCVTDVLLLLYLKTLEEHELTFENELKLLDKPFFKFAAGLIKAGQLGSSQAEIQQALATLYQNASFLISTTTPEVSLKKPIDIRGTSDASLLLLSQEWLKRELSTETQHEHLKNSTDFADLSDAYWLYRYFSQHEHYSPGGSHFIHLPQSFECIQWYKVLVTCFDVVRLASKKLRASDILLEDLYINAEHLYKRLSEHQEDVDTAGK